MKLPAKINITTIQNDDRIEIITEGTVEVFPDSTSIEYVVDDNKSIITVSSDSVSVTKFSGPAYTMVFSSEKEQSPFQILYPGGSISLSSKPNKVLVKKEDKKIDIYLSYTLEYDATQKTDHKMRIVCNY